MRQREGAPGKVLCQCEVVATMPERECCHPEGGKVQDHGDGRDHNSLLESQAGQQSQSEGIIKECKVTEEKVTQPMLSAHGHRQSGYTL